MITHLKGKLVEKNPTHVVIECAGIGYFVNISLNTFSKIADHESILIYTHLQIKEDAHSLFGFADKAEREIFRLLLSVSGIGSSTARTMLSSLTPIQIRDAIASGDVPTIQGIKGIGAKTAQRVIVDLKDKMLKFEFSSENLFVSNNTERNDALTALVSLGFDKKSAEKALDKVATGEETVEELIKGALKIL